MLTNAIGFNTIVLSNCQIIKEFLRISGSWWVLTIAVFQASAATPGIFSGLRGPTLAQVSANSA
jgi:hypothetical protein